MASLAQIRAGLKATIEAAATDLTTYEKVPESVIVPACVVLPTSTTFDGAFGRGMDTYAFDLILLISRRDDELAQFDLDPYVNGFGSSSIRQAIWNARDLGLGDGTTARVTGMSDYGATRTVGSTDYVTATLAVEVMTSGTA